MLAAVRSFTFDVMKQSIELFSGSAQISEYFSSQGFSTFTVDHNPKFCPDLCADIRNVVLPFAPGSIDLFWASPDCSKLSRSADQRHWIKSTVKYRIYDYVPATEAAQISFDLVSRTVEIIKELQPAVWFVENPVGRIPHLSPLKSIGHYRYAVNYKDWGFPYSKETYIFTNQLLPLPTVVQKRFGLGLRSVNNSYNRSLVPAGLVQFLLSHSNFITI